MRDSAFDCVSRAMSMGASSVAWLPEIHAKLGWLYERVDQFDLAVHHYESALAFDSNHTTSLTRMGALENKVCEGRVCVDNSGNVSSFE